MKIRQFASAITIASLGFCGVSCKSTKSAKGGSDDGAYVGGYDSGNGEYDNVYEMGGSDDDSYSYETADSSGSSSSSCTTTSRTTTARARPEQQIRACSRA